MKNIAHGLSRILRHRGKKPQALGERELEVMKILWQQDALSAKQVLQHIPDSGLSLSTMQSTLERLHRKELLCREKAGRFFIYRAAISRSEMITQLLGEMAEQISDGQMAPMISGFMAFVDQETTESSLTDTQDVIEELSPDSDD